jgi:DNA-binding NarL/FixJ family response regulator
MRRRKKDLDHDMDSSLKVLIADDHPLVRQGIRRALEAARDIRIVGEAGSGSELLALVERRRPQLVLVDLRMPDLDGVQCIAAIAARRPQVKTVVISACEERSSIDAALHAGASAYVVKSADPADIPAVLRRVASSASRRPFVVPPTCAAQHTTAGYRRLTRRETAILGAIAAGLTTKTISRQMWLSEHTVKFHLTNIYRKLGVSNRSGAVRYAVENGLAPGGAIEAVA